MICETLNTEPGRPATDATSEVALHFERSWVGGATVTSIAKAGLRIIGYRHQREASLAEVRHLKGKKLEVAFREAERAMTMPWLRKEDVPEGATLHRPIFMGRPLPQPIGLPEWPERKRGRPKK